MKAKKIVTVICCLFVQLFVGILYLWSIFKANVSAYYGMSASNCNMVQSIMMFGFVLGNLLGGYLQDRFNARLSATIGVITFSAGVLVTAFVPASANFLVYVTYGAIGGLGCGITYGSVLSCLQKWFPTKRGFASGLSVSAFGFSTVVFAPVAKWLMNMFDGNMMWTFLSLGGLFLILGTVCCLFISAPSAEFDVAAVGKFLTPKDTLKESRFWIIALTLFFVNATWNIVCPIIYDLGVARGLSAESATLLLSLTGVFSAVGRLSMATVSDKLGRTATVTILAVLTGICAAALIFASNGLFFVVVLLVAFGYGGPSAILPALTTDLCGSKYSGTNYGMAMLGLGFSSLAFNGISTALVGGSGDYTLSFVIAAVTAVISVGLMFAFKTITDKKNRALSSNDEAKTV